MFSYFVSFSSFRMLDNLRTERIYEDFEIKYRMFLSTSAPMTAASPTNVSHILFGISGSARTWHGRRGYSELWWRPGVTRGFVWLDEDPPASWPPTCPPYLVSSNASRFGDYAPAARIANIAAETYFKLILSGKELGVRWLATVRRKSTA